MIVIDLDKNMRLVLCALYADPPDSRLGIWRLLVLLSAVLGVAAFVLKAGGGLPTDPFQLPVAVLDSARHQLSASLYHLTA